MNTQVSKKPSIVPSLTQLKTGLLNNIPLILTPRKSGTKKTNVEPEDSPRLKSSYSGFRNLFKTPVTPSTPSTPRRNSQNSHTDSSSSVDVSNPRTSVELCESIDVKSIDESEQSEEKLKRNSKRISIEIQSLEISAKKKKENKENDDKKLAVRKSSDLERKSQERDIMTEFLRKQKIYELEIATMYMRYGFEYQMKVDCEMWYQTLLKPGDEKIKGILTRIFTVLRYGGLMYRHDKEWKCWHELGFPICSALSHGGRILIQLPRAPLIESKTVKKKKGLTLFGNNFQSTDESLNDQDFWTWLITGSSTGDLRTVVTTSTSGDKARQEKKIVFRRLGATHGIVYKNVEPIDLPNGRKKLTMEIKEPLGVNTRNTKVLRKEEVILKKHRHWGFNIPLGGEGNISKGIHPVRIHANGEHGHVYLHYMSPGTHRNGGVLVGVEGSEYGKPSQSGMLHDISGTSSPISVTHGYKWRHKDEPRVPSLKDTGGPDKFDSMIVDLSYDWKFLQKCKWEDELVKQTALPPMDFKQIRKMSLF